MVSSHFGQMAVPGNAGKDSEGIWFEVAPACRGTDGCNPGGRIGVLGVVRTHDDREAVEDGPNERTDANIDCNIIDGGEGGGAATSPRSDALR